MELPAADIAGKPWSGVMTTWVIRDGSGRILPDVACSSRYEVGRRILPGRYDPFRLEVSSSYRELFDKALQQALDREGWQIVRAPRGAGAGARATA
jgi:hypothetical protein